MQAASRKCSISRQAPLPPYLFTASAADELARAAIDPAHGIDHLALFAAELAFDVRVEPALGATPIDNALRKIVSRIFEGEDLVGAVLRLAAQAEASFLLPGRRCNVEDALGSLLEAQVLEVHHLALQHRLAHAHHHVALQREPFLAELAEAALAFPAA